MDSKPALHDDLVGLQEHNEVKIYVFVVNLLLCFVVYFLCFYCVFVVVLLLYLYCLLVES